VKSEKAGFAGLKERLENCAHRALLGYHPPTCLEAALLSRICVRVEEMHIILHIAQQHRSRSMMGGGWWLVAGGGARYGRVHTMWN